MIYNVISPSLNDAKIFDSIPHEQSQQVDPDSWANHMHSDLHRMMFRKCPLLGGI